MGLREPSHTGCILADEMGLGKTLQVGASSASAPVPGFSSVQLIWVCTYFTMAGADSNLDTDQARPRGATGSQQGVRSVTMHAHACLGASYSCRGFPFVG
jgi:hypothetical protein